MMCWLTCLRHIKETERGVWVLIRFETAAAFEKSRERRLTSFCCIVHQSDALCSRARKCCGTLREHLV